ncbi:hypothetical protein DHEL01_v207307 [Diaporthe helianthi]|uniref:Uncharacterized protein n=1 Tax=Diaporthe helianthi TaxID=158607 RepID=A0A2P5HVM0_DIAHE|nr:hypothetical protein DHEL01_v207307 [Diaporthe helianthi]
MMAWQDATISVLSIVFLISHAIYSAITASLTTAAQLGLFLLRLASWPISAFYNTLLFVFAPVTYTIRFVLAPFFFVFNKLPRLEPLYIYTLFTHTWNLTPTPFSKQFGSAAFVGVTFGLILTLTSSSMFAVLGLYDDGDKKQENNAKDAGGKGGEHRSDHHHHNHYADGDEEAGLHRRNQGSTNPLLSGSEQDKLDALLSSLSYQDSDVGALALGGWRDSPNIKRKRRSAAALRIGTILEEDDDDSF